MLEDKDLRLAKAGSRIARSDSDAVFWAGRKMNLRRSFTAALSLVVFGCVLVWCEVTPESRLIPQRPPLAQLEVTLRRVPAHLAEYSTMAEPLALPQCGEVRPPEALLTPDPPLVARDDDRKVRVSFIIGSDGHVYSAFILDGGNPGEDRIVLRAVQLWRYRPALCNGVPTESEARISFTAR